MLDTTIYSLILSIFVGVATGYLGSLMVLEKMALVGDALSHVALPGLAIGITFHFNPYLRCLCLFVCFSSHNLAYSKSHKNFF